MVEWITETFGLVYRESWAVEQIFECIKNLFTAGSFKKFAALLTAIGELVGMLATGTAVTPYGQELDLTDYSLVFCDEFDGEELDTDVWTSLNRSQRGGFVDESQVELKDGNLIITGEYLEDGKFGPGWYAADLVLNEMYTHGYYEIRCISNPGEGFWSAFWLQAPNAYNAEISKGGVGGCEIDIMETMGYAKPDPNFTTFSIHCAGLDGIDNGINSVQLGNFKVPNIFTEYNTFGLEWTEEEYIFYINGVEACRSTYGNGVSQVPEEVRVTMCVNNANALSKLDKDFETQFIVDYVKIYQK